MSENKMKAMYPIVLPKSSNATDNIRSAENINEQHLNDNFNTLLKAVLNAQETIDTGLAAIGINVQREDWGHGVEADVITMQVRDENGHDLKVVLAGDGLHFYDNEEEMVVVGQDREGYSYGYIELTDNANGADSTAEITGSGMLIQDGNTSKSARYGTECTLDGTVLRKSLWTGTAAADDTFQVPDISKYHLLEISFQGKYTKVLATVGGVPGDGYIRGVGGYATGTSSETLFYFNASLGNSDSITIVKARSVTGSTREALTITEIFGLM